MYLAQSEIEMFNEQERTVSEMYPTASAAGAYQDPDAVPAAAALATSLTTLGYAMFALMVPGPLENIQPITTAEDHLRTQPSQQPVEQVAVAEPEPEPVVMVDPEPVVVEYIEEDPVPVEIQVVAPAPAPIPLEVSAPANEAFVPVSAAVANEFGDVDTVAPNPFPGLPVVPDQPMVEAAEPVPAPTRVNKSTLTMLQEISFLDE